MTPRLHTVLFDLGGTTTDCGLVSQATVLAEVFRRRGVALHGAAARAATGVDVRDGVQRALADPTVGAAWLATRGRWPGEAELDEVANEAAALQLGSLGERSRPIPGFVPVARTLRARSLRLGATTTQSPRVVAAMQPLMHQHGWVPEVLVCPSDVPVGRPAPYMNQVAAMRLGAPDVVGCVAVGDTVLDIEAARNAGMWAVGVTLTGGQVGLGWEGLRALGRSETTRLRDEVGKTLLAAGAHLLVDTVLDLPAALDFLERPSAAAYKRWKRGR